MEDFIIENWKYIVVVVVGLVIFGGGKFVEMFKKIPSLFTKKTKPIDNSVAEAADLNAIMHLRDRAVAIKDKELLSEIKSVSNKIFDLYSQIDKGI